MELIEKIQLRAESSRLKQLRKDVRSAISDLCDDNDYIDKLIIAINEACMNVIQHAYDGENKGLISLEIFTDNEHLIFYLIDYAKTIDPEKVKSRDLDDIRPGGLGTHFINEIMKEVYFLENPGDAGNILVMKADINPARENR